MARPGEMIQHPVTKERLVWRKVARDTNGQLLQADFFAEPGGFVAAEHVHPNQEERFEVLAGTLRLQVDGRERILQAGDVAIVPAGRRHVWRNAGNNDVNFLLEFTPALRSEVFFETWFGLGADGKTDRGGMPSLLQLAAVMDEFEEEIRPASPPFPIQRALFWPLAILARALGHRGWYPRYSADPLTRA